MNIEETEQFHALAMAMDSRIQPMDDDGIMAKAWQMIFEPIPYAATREILVRLYRRPQMLVLQPGQVMEAWEELREEWQRLIDRIASIDRYLECFPMDDESILQARRKARERSLGELPDWLSREVEHGRYPALPV